MINFLQLGDMDKIFYDFSSKKDIEIVNNLLLNSLEKYLNSISNTKIIIDDGVLYADEYDFEIDLYLYFNKNKFLSGLLKILEKENIL